MASIKNLVADERTHPLRYFGVLAPNSPLRCAVTAMAASAQAPTAHYLWAVLIARIYEVFPLLCPNCGGRMRLIASPARGPPLWNDGGDALAGESDAVKPDWDQAAQPACDYEVGQRVDW